jgi:hypothetical protein
MNPIEGARIRVRFHGTYEDGYSNENGYYFVDNIPICYCLKNVSCSKDGYETEWAMVSIDENTVYDFVLTPSDVILIIDGPMGENGWYIDGVWITFVYNHDEIAELFYRIDNMEWTLYTEPIYFDEDGEEHNLEYYFVDWEGHMSNPCGPLTFKIDSTPPTIELSWDSDNTLIIADVNDETSGIAKVEFFVDDEYLGEVTSPPYEWEWSGSGFFRSAHAIAYDNAGNSLVSDVIDSIILMNTQNFQERLDEIDIDVLDDIRFPNLYEFVYFIYAHREKRLSRIVDIAVDAGFGYFEVRHPLLLLWAYWLGITSAIWLNFWKGISDNLQWGWFEDY